MEEYFYWYVALQCGLAGPSTLLVPSYLQESPFSEFGKPSDCVNLKLTNLDLIDASNAEWKQILEVRADKDSRVALKRLRTFLSAQSPDGSEVQIRDDISDRIYNYELAARKHGLDLRDGFLVKTLSSSALSSAVGAVGSFLGQSASALTLSATPILLTIGAAIFEMAKTKRQYFADRRSDPIFYIIETTERLRES